MPNLLDSCWFDRFPASIRQFAEERHMAFPLSLRHFIAAPGCPRSRGVRIHLKFLLPVPHITEKIKHMRRVYNAADISVMVGSREDLIGPRFTRLLDPDIGFGIRYTTDDEKELGKNRNFAGANDIVIYFLHTVSPGVAAGMAYIEDAGAVVKFASSNSTLAHEVAHVLGLNHTRDANCANPEPCTNALMDNCNRCFGDEESTLNPDEIQTMRESRFTFEGER